MVGVVRPTGILSAPRTNDNSRRVHPKLIGAEEDVLFEIKYKRFLAAF